ncbi:Gelsolin-like protein 1 [Toxocara canis]|uniref:Gelsolin-like protein 1 n=1 Tax=Toxocara canis TaxID=6265 RepID=A0A0B2V7J4_TOXCA|nr:Gelsolin-like protein 1 [Toxocara canis]
MSIRPYDSQFSNVGKCDSIVVWRVDKMKLTTVPANEYGVFYEGDSYLLLRTFGTRALSWNIHMWIGKDSSADEQCTCVYKSIELDELLNWKAIQYRETQNHESKQFLSYFKRGIRYMVGGVRGGLRHLTINNEEERHLFHVKGRYNCRVQQVAVDIRSLNKGDTFILVNGLNIFVWNGPKCNISERIKAAEVARSFRDEKAGKARITLIDDDWNTNKEFYALLNSKPGVEIMESVEDDMEFERRFDDKVKLFRVSDASGIMSVVEVKPPLSKDSLDTNDCFFLDMGSAGIYVWIGNGCTSEESKSVWLQAKDYLVSHELPLHIPLIKVNEGREPTVMKIALNWPPDHPYKNTFIEGLGGYRFDCFFLDMGSAGIYVWIGNGCTSEESKSVWLQAKDYLVSHELPLHIPLIKVNEGREPTVMKIALNWPPDHPYKNTFIEGLGVAKIREEDHRVDVRSMWKRISEPEAQLPDIGTGTVKVWRIVRFQLEEVPASDYGIFFSGDSYIVYYRGSSASHVIIYFWLGMLSTVDEKGAAAMFTTQINQHECGGHAVEVRLIQSKESAHFLAIFGGFIITMLGGKASGFKERKEKDDERSSGQVRLFQVRNNHVSQVEPRAKSLNSGDAFLLDCIGECFVWIGKGSTENENKIAKKCLQRLKITHWKEIKEGEESENFWNALGGKASYATGGTFNIPAEYTARLFHCSNSRGYFHVEEICDFSQCDLEPDDVMLLDTFREIFVWIGSGANLIEQKEVLKLAVVEPRAKSLNSGDAFLLDCIGECFVWIGKGSTENENKIAKKCLQRLKITHWKEIKEGEESENFWNALGGKASYATGGTFNIPAEYTARLFHCSNSRGYFHVEEICDFSQCDLEPDDVMLLDTFREIFVWIGSGANLIEQKEVLKLAVQYVKQDPCRRNLDDTVMLTIKQGFEPFSFTAHFPSWDANYWKNLPSYEQIKQSLNEEANGYGRITTVQEAIEQFEKTYSIEVLRKSVDDLPYGVDPCRKEDHLSNEEFESVFGYSREYFDKLKPWKRLDEKRRVGLF